MPNETNTWNNNTILDMEDLFEIINSNPVLLAEFKNLTAVIRAKRLQNVTYRVLMGMQKYFTPVIIIVGLITNIMSCFVFMKTSLRRQSSSVYLTCLAISDCVFLLSLFISWLSWVNIDLYHRNGFCQVLVYVNYVCIFLSVYIVVAFTAERYIICAYPLRRMTTCTVSRAWKVVGAMAVVALLLYSFSPWTSGIVTFKVPSRNGHYHGCTTFMDYIAVVDVLMSIDTVVTLIVPSATIICLNILIGFKLYQYNHNHHYEEAVCTLPEVRCHGNDACSRRDVAACSRPSPSRRGRRDVSTTRSCRRCWRCQSQMRVTRMLLVVSTVFVCLNLPSHVFRVHGFIVELVHDKKPYLSTSVRHVQGLLQFLHYLNFSINFFVYSLTAKRFRSALRQLIRKVARRLRLVLQWTCFIYEDSNTFDTPSESTPQASRGNHEVTLRMRERNRSRTQEEDEEAKHLAADTS